MARVGAGNRVLAPELGVAVNRLRLCLIFLHIGMERLTGEHVVGGNMYHGHTQRRRGLGDASSPDDIDLVGLVPFVLGPIDCGLGSRRNDDLGFLNEDCPSNRQRVG